MKALLALVASLVPATALAKTWHVDDDARGGKATGTAAAPFTTVAEAFAKADDGDTIKIAVGTYDGSVTLELEKGRGHTRTVIGGFPGGTAADYAAGKPGAFDARAGRAELRGVKAGRPVLAILMPEGDDTGKVVVEGLKLTGGTGLDHWGMRGGGLYVRGGETLVTDLLVEGNRSYPSTASKEHKEKSLGGGIYVNGKVTLDRVIVRKNVAGRGGGIAGDGLITVKDSLICDNVGESDHGGGIYLFGKVTLLRNFVDRNEVGTVAGYGWGGGIIVLGTKTIAHLEGNRVTRNKAPSKGSGVFVDDEAKATLVNELYWGNKCTKDGGVGLYVDGLEKGSEVVIDRSTIAGHDCGRADVGGNGVLAEGRSKVEIKRSIFWGNSGDDFETITNSVITASQTTSKEGIDGPGNTTKDPRFVDAKKGDFHLKAAGCRWDAGKRVWRTGDKDASPLVTTPQGDARGVFAGTPEASRPTGTACAGLPAPAPTSR